MYEDSCRNHYGTQTKIATSCDNVCASTSCTSKTPHGRAESGLAAPAECGVHFLSGIFTLHNGRNLETTVLKTV